MNHENAINEIMAWLEILAQATKESEDPLAQPYNQSIQIMIKEAHLAIIRHQYRIDIINSNGKYNFTPAPLWHY